MTYQTLAKSFIQTALMLMLVLLAWASYHQMMSTMSTMPMDAMADHQASPVSCLAFCFTASKIDISEIMQSVFYSFTRSLSALQILLLISVVTFIVLSRQRIDQLIISSFARGLRSYYRQQRWKFKLFSLWTSLFQQGIIAPQIYS
ncbi:MAG: hypothetical protein ACD_43C00250G0003 [uncultured bacterium]|nr:MAG: hypothetical protein ACD_43C00250G0003 [uncultured bacterium]